MPRILQVIVVYCDPGLECRLDPFPARQLPQLLLVCNEDCVRVFKLGSGDGEVENAVGQAVAQPPLLLLILGRLGRLSSAGPGERATAGRLVVVAGMELRGACLGCSACLFVGVDVERRWVEGEVSSIDLL